MFAHPIPQRQRSRILAGAQRAPGLAGDQEAGHASSGTKKWQNAERDDGAPVGPVPPTAAHNESCQQEAAQHTHRCDS